MSEPATEVVPPPSPRPEPRPEAPRRVIPTPVIAAAAAAIILIGALATTPFWAPAAMRLLPWGTPDKAAEMPKPPPQATPVIADPAIAAAKAQASQNAAALKQLAQRVAALEARPTPPAPDLAPIEQQLGALAKTTADLKQSVAALDKAAQAPPAADPKNTALVLVLLQIREAVDIGRPFDAEYHALVALARDHPDIAAAAAPFATPAASGVASRAVLAERLRQLAPQIATAQPPPASTWDAQIVARLRSLVTIRRIDGGEQTPAEAAVGAAQRAMAGGDLAAAVAALDGLYGANRATAEPWLTMAKARLAVEAALRQVQAAVTVALGTPMPAGKS